MTSLCVLSIGCLIKKCLCLWLIRKVLQKMSTGSNQGSIHIKYNHCVKKANDQVNRNIGRDLNTERERRIVLGLYKSPFFVVVAWKRWWVLLDAKWLLMYCHERSVTLWWNASPTQVNPHSTNHELKIEGYSGCDRSDKKHKTIKR